MLKSKGSKDLPPLPTVLANEPTSIGAVLTYKEGKRVQTNVPLTVISLEEGSIWGRKLGTFADKAVSSRRHQKI